MKVKDEINLEILLDYGFLKIDKEDESDNEEYNIARFDYKFEIGHARRGQFYYLLVKDESRNIMIYSSEPDGSGGVVSCPDVLLKLMQDNILEL